MGFDKILRVAVGGDYEAGSEISYEHGPYSDSETLLRYHSVEETKEASFNPHNKIMINLPAAKGFRRGRHLL